MAQALHSLSFNSRDALYKTDDGTYVFRMATHVPTASRIMLGTIELPLSQFPVESSWNRVYFSEGVRLSETCRTLKMEERYMQSLEKNTIDVVLPVFLRRNQSVKVIDSSDEEGLTLEITTNGPHNMWAAYDEEGASEFANLAQEWDWGDPVRLVGTSIGDVAFHPLSMQFVSPETFRVTSARCSTSEAGQVASGTQLVSPGHLHAPTVPGPLQLASIIQRSIHSLNTDQIYTVSVSSSTGGLIMSTNSLNSGSNNTNNTATDDVIITISGDNLASMVGLSGASATWQRRKAEGTDRSSFGLSSISQRETLPGLVASTSVIRPSDLTLAPEHSPYQVGGGASYTGGVGVASLPIGWYDLSLRATGASGRHPFARSWTKAISPLYLAPSGKPLPPVDPSTGESLVSHWFIHFTDPLGIERRVMVPIGNYSTQMFCDFLSSSMSLVSQGGDVEVTFVKDDSAPMMGRFSFAVKPGQEVVPAPSMFSIDFGHPMATFDPERLGFSRTLYSGSSSYASPCAVSIPDLQTPPSSSLNRPAQGVWGAEIIGEERRLKFTCQPRENMMLVIKDYGDGEDEATFEVRSGDGRPVSHGFQDGDVVRLRQQQIRGGDSAQIMQRREGSVLYDWNPVAGVPLDEGSAPINVNLRVRGATRNPLDACYLLTVETPRVLTVNGSTAPFKTHLRKGLWHVCAPRDTYPSLYFDGEACPGTISPEMLGLPAMVPEDRGSSGFTSTAQSGNRQTALVWGSIGDVSLGNGPHRAWPLSGWSMYRFDPPEICLIYFNEKHGKGSSFLQHMWGSDVTLPFARINLGSLHREGGLKSEVISTSGEVLTIFHMRIANPDGSRYHMHNSWFSFTLNLIS